MSEKYKSKYNYFSQEYAFENLNWKIWAIWSGPNI